MKVLFLSSEVAPFSCESVLGEICGVIPHAMKSLGHDVRVITPRYREVRERRFGLRDVARLRSLSIKVTGKEYLCSVKSGFIPDSKVQVYFLDNEQLFNRIGIYSDPENGADWSDNCLRFAFFNHASLQLMLHLQWFPDIIHCNDWESALIPYLINTNPQYQEGFRQARAFLHIHNPDQSGVFNMDEMISGCLQSDEVDPDSPLVLNEAISFLKAGLLTADGLVFTQLDLAEKIDKSNIDSQIKDIIDSRLDQAHVIQIGTDKRFWNPATDKFLTANFTDEEFIEAKAENKTVLQKEADLPVDPDIPLVAMLIDQTNSDAVNLFVDAIKNLKDIKSQWIFCGEFSPVSLKIMKEAEFDQSVVIRSGNDKTFKHKLLGGADIFLNINRIDICNVNYMHGLIYGAVPVVYLPESDETRLRDIEAFPKNGNGFVFTEKEAPHVVEALKRAFSKYEKRDDWRLLQLDGICSNLTWERSVEKLVEHYREVKEKQKYCAEKSI